MKTYSHANQYKKDTENEIKFNKVLSDFLLEVRAAKCYCTQENVSMAI